MLENKRCWCILANCLNKLQRDFMMYALFIMAKIVKITLWQNKLVFEAGRIKESQSLKKNIKFWVKF